MMLHFLRAVGMALAVLAAALCCGAATPNNDLVVLPAIRVYGGWITVNYHYGKDGRVVRVVLQEVTPNSPADRFGLRKGDELIAIDGVDVAGMSGEQFVRAYSNELPPHASRDYDFRCYRGFLGSRERTVRFRITN